MRAALRAIDFIQVLEGEAELSGQVLDPLAEVAFREGRQLVEQRLNDGGVENDHNQLEDEPRRRMWY